MENKQNSLVNSDNWVIGYPKEKGVYWITTKLCEYESHLARFEGERFYLILRSDLFPVEMNDVLAYMPLEYPVPCMVVLRNKCPFCGNIGTIIAGDTSETDNATCFVCDYTVKKSIWEAARYYDN